MFSTHTGRLPPPHELITWASTKYKKLLDVSEETKEAVELEGMKIPEYNQTRASKQTNGRILTNKEAEKLHSQRMKISEKQEVRHQKENGRLPTDTLSYSELMQEAMTGSCSSVKDHPTELNKEKHAESELDIDAVEKYLTEETKANPMNKRSPNRSKNTKRRSRNNLQMESISSSAEAPVTLQHNTDAQIKATNGVIVADHESTTSYDCVESKLNLIKRGTPLTRRRRATYAGTSADGEGAGRLTARND